MLPTMLLLLVPGQCPDLPPARVFRLDPVAAREVKPRLVLADEIKSTEYATATMPDGKTCRVPVINGTAPEIRAVYDNGVLTSLEYHYATGVPHPGGDITAEKIKGGIGIEESSECVDQYGRRVVQVTRQYVVHRYMPRAAKTAVPDSPDQKLRRPSDVPK